MAARLERDCRGEYVAGFDARHCLPLVVAKIGERGRSLLPRIPYYRGCGVLLFGADGAAGGGIDQVNRCNGVEVSVVGGRGQGDIAGLKLLAVGVGVIEVRDLVEAAHANR